MCYEATQCAIQLAALALLFMYGCQYIPNARFKPAFDVYDAPAFAPSRYFLPTREIDAAVAARLEADARTGVCAQVCRPAAANVPSSPPPPLELYNASSSAPPPPAVIEYEEYDEDGQLVSYNVTAGEVAAVDSCRMCVDAAVRAAAGSTTSGTEASTQQYSMPLPGQADRWMLPEQRNGGGQAGGLAEVADMMQDAQHAHYIFVSGDRVMDEVVPCSLILLLRLGLPHDEPACRSARPASVTYYTHAASLCPCANAL